jgi:hypothetical protein
MSHIDMTNNIDDDQLKSIQRTNMYSWLMVGVRKVVVINYDKSLKCEGVI